MKFIKKIIIPAILLLCTFTIVKAGDTAIITGNINQLNDGDNVILITNRYGTPGFDDFIRKDTVKVSNHKFSFNVPIDKGIIRVSIQFKEKDFIKSNKTNMYSLMQMNNYFLEPGDQIEITNGPSGFYFSGKGGNKFQLMSQLYDMFKQMKPAIGDIKEVFEENDNLRIKQLKLLNDNSKYITDNIYFVLKTAIIGNFYGKAGYITLTSLKRADTLVNILNLPYIKQRYALYKSTFPIRELDTEKLRNNSLMVLADVYTSGILINYKFEQCYLKEKPFRVKDYCQYIIKNYSGLLRERLLVNVLSYHQEDNISESVNIAIKYVHETDLVTIIKKLSANRIVGSTPYNFNLPDAKGNRYTLNDFKGKVVFIDFWFTGCGNCKRVAPYLKEIEKSFEGKPIVFLSINMDYKKEQWLTSIKSGEYTSDLNLNLFTDGMGTRHPIISYYNVDGGPTLLLIDKYGRLAKNPTDPRGDNGKALTDQINKELNR